MLRAIYKFLYICIHQNKVTKSVERSKVKRQVKYIYMLDMELESSAEYLFENHIIDNLLTLTDRLSIIIGFKHFEIFAWKMMKM